MCCDLTERETDVICMCVVADRGEGSEYTVAVSVKMLDELNALHLKLDRAESSLNTFLYIPVEENAPDECTRHITATQVHTCPIHTTKYTNAQKYYSWKTSLGSFMLNNTILYNITHKHNPD